jgi:hypothetical protein
VARSAIEAIIAAARCDSVVPQITNVELRAIGYRQTASLRNLRQCGRERYGVAVVGHEDARNYARRGQR